MILVPKLRLGMISTNQIIEKIRKHEFSLQINETIFSSLAVCFYHV